MNVPIGYTHCDIETRFKCIRYTETNFANFYTDLLKIEFNTDVAFFNTGTIRSDDVI